MYNKTKKRTFEILEVAKVGDLSSKVFDIFILILILLNVIFVILGTVESLSSRYSHFFRIFEIFSVSIFTIEYILRIWTCTINNRFRNSIKGRIRFVFTPMLIVDFIAILPFYLPMIIHLDLRFLRAIRLFRIFRLFKIGRYSIALKKFGNVFRKKKEELFVASFGVVILLVIASSLLYIVEKEAQPEAFANIPSAMWWGVSALTTVGYGDIYPVTIVGKLFGAIVAILGIGMFALPAGILASGFAEEIQKKQKERKTCPHCGKEID